MPVEHLQQRWQFHQRMNKKVWTNLNRLRAISAQVKSKQDILDALHPWRLSTTLRFNNSFAILQFSIGIIFLIAALFFFSSMPWLWMLIWLAALGLCIYAYLSIEKQSDIDQIIQQLSDQVFQYQYDIKLNQFPQIDKNMLNPTHMLMRIRQGFECLNEGNAGNNLTVIAATSWHIDGHDFPILLFHYECITEASVSDQNGNRIKKQVVSHRWGACVFDLPPLAFMVSNTESTYSRYPIKWTTSDIQFNRKFHIAGQQEFELARNLNPQRILALANNLEQMRGTLMFHDQMNAFCYVSSQNIFATQQPKKPITDISMLRGYLRTLRALNYERMQDNLSAIIRQFKDDEFIAKLPKKN